MDYRAKTCRDSGAVGLNPLVYRWLHRLSEHNPKILNKSILDFGSGKSAKHTERLRILGFKDVTAYELPDNQVEGIHNAKALDKQYDIVLLSNVLNVQSSAGAINDVLEIVRKILFPGGFVILNYPVDPRKATVDNLELQKMIESRFQKVNYEKTPGFPAKGVVLCLAEKTIIN